MSDTPLAQVKLHWQRTVVLANQDVLSGEYAEFTRTLLLRVMADHGLDEASAYALLNAWGVLKGS